MAERMARRVVGPHDPQPSPRYHCTDCDAGYYNSDVAEECCTTFQQASIEVTRIIHGGDG